MSPARAIALLAAAGLLAAGCVRNPPPVQPPSSPAASSSTSPSPSPTPTVSPTPYPTPSLSYLAPPPGPTVTVVEVHDQFVPAHIVIAQDQTLVIRNEGTVPHNFQVPGTAIDVTTPPGTTSTIPDIGQYLAVGTYQVIDAFYQADGMVGVLSVALPATPTPSP